MFSSKSFVGKRRVGVLFTVLFVLCLAAGAVLFAGCDTDSISTPGNLEGVWSSGTGDGYEIYGNTLIYNGYDSRPNGRYSFIATIENDPNFSVPSGVLIVKYVMPPFYDNTGSENYAEPTNSYIGIYWRELSSGAVSLANASSYPTEVEAATYSDAVSKFTPAAANDFVSWGYVTAQVRQYPNRGALRGTWDDTANLLRAIITSTTYTVYVDGDSNGLINLDGVNDFFQYSGFIEETDPVSAVSGNMYVKLSNTDALMGSDIGDYLVVHWEDLSESSVKLADVVTPVAYLGSAKTINSGAAVDDDYIAADDGSGNLLDYYNYALTSRRRP
ncbi:MAG: hypothetical protein LBQ14_09785 [Treponema sp.]|jgi:hypothetical protein|nr:hypothetical protein [Treponema sp.]